MQLNKISTMSAGPRAKKAQFIFSIFLSILVSGLLQSAEAGTSEVRRKCKSAVTSAKKTPVYNATKVIPDAYEQLLSWFWDNFKHGRGARRSTISRDSEVFVGGAKKGQWKIRALHTALLYEGYRREQGVSYATLRLLVKLAEHHSHGKGNFSTGTRREEDILGLRKGLRPGRELSLLTSYVRLPADIIPFLERVFESRCPLRGIFIPEEQHNGGFGKKPWQGSVNKLTKNALKAVMDLVDGYEELRHLDPLLILKVLLLEFATDYAPTSLEQLERWAYGGEANTPGFFQLDLIVALHMLVQHNQGNLILSSGVSGSVFHDYP